MVAPATNFTAALPKAGCLGIKKALDDNGIGCVRSAAAQAPQLKLSMDELQLKKKEAMIALFDAVEMHPSIKHKLAEKAATRFAGDLSSEIEGGASARLEMTKLGAGSTLLTLVDVHYECSRDEAAEERGLAIGGCESAWLAGLVAALLLECASERFDNARFKGACRGDGAVALEGNLSISDVAKWLRELQTKVSELAAGGGCLRLAAEARGRDKDDGAAHDGVKVRKKGTFLCLDVEICWLSADELLF